MKDFSGHGEEANTLDYQHVVEDMAASHYRSANHIQAAFGSLGSARVAGYAGSRGQLPTENHHLATGLRQIVPVQQTALSQNKKWLSRSKPQSQLNQTQDSAFNADLEFVGHVPNKESVNSLDSVGLSKSIEGSSMLKTYVSNQNAETRNQSITREQIINDGRYHQDMDIADYDGRKGSITTDQGMK